MGSLVGELVPHPDSVSGPVERIRAGVGREYPDQLFVAFKLEGDLSGIRIGQPTRSGRYDNLWQTTCFECFVGDAGSPAYREFNLSPSGGWAAYDFVSYREGMTNSKNVVLGMVQELADNWITLETHLPISIPVEPRRLLTWRIGLSAVIEQADGTKSYWALAHPPGKPDFHHPDCFTLELPPPSGA